MGEVVAQPLRSPWAAQISEGGFTLYVEPWMTGSELQEAIQTMIPSANLEEWVMESVDSVDDREAWAFRRA